MATPSVQHLIAAGLSKSFAYHVVNGVRTMAVPLALWLFEQDGLKAGPLAGKTAAEIKMLRRLYEPAAPRSVLERRARLAASSPAAAAA